MKRILFVLFVIFCCSQMSAQIELKNQGVTWLEIYNSSQYNDMVNAISRAIGFRPVETTKDERSGGLFSTSKIATWTIQDNAGRKSIFEYVKTGTSTFMGSDYEVCFSSNYIFPIHEKKQAQAKFDDIYKSIFKELGNPKKTFSPSKHSWNTAKAETILEMRQENSMWNVIEKSTSNK